MTARGRGGTRPARGWQPRSRAPACGRAGREDCTLFASDAHVRGLAASARRFLKTSIPLPPPTPRHRLLLSGFRACGVGTARRRDTARRSCHAHLRVPTRGRRLGRREPRRVAPLTRATFRWPRRGGCRILARPRRLSSLASVTRNKKRKRPSICRSCPTDLYADPAGAAQICDQTQRFGPATRGGSEPARLAAG